MEAILIHTDYLSPTQIEVLKKLSEISEFRKYLNELINYHDAIPQELKHFAPAKRKLIIKKIRHEIDNITFMLQHFNAHLIELAAAAIIKEGEIKHVMAD